MRISRELMYMEIARSLAKRSTCFRQNVGAVIVDPVGWKIAGTGYNGSPPGHHHCKGNNCQLTSTGGCDIAVHAEINALSRKAEGAGFWMFTTLSPCVACSVAIVESGSIKRVYYSDEYRDSYPLVFLDAHQIDVYRVTPSGYIVDWLNKVIVSE